MDGPEEKSWGLGTFAGYVSAAFAGAALTVTFLLDLDDLVTRAKAWFGEPAGLELVTFEPNRNLTFLGWFDRPPSNKRVCRHAEAVADMDAEGCLNWRGLGLRRDDPWVYVLSDIILERRRLSEHRRGMEGKPDYPTQPDFETIARCEHGAGAGPGTDVLGTVVTEASVDAWKWVRPAEPHKTHAIVTYSAAAHKECIRLLDVFYEEAVSPESGEAYVYEVSGAWLEPVFDTQIVNRSNETRFLTGVGFAMWDYSPSMGTSDERTFAASPVPTTAEYTVDLSDYSFWSDVRDPETGKYRAVPPREDPVINIAGNKVLIERRDPNGYPIVLHVADPPLRVPGGELLRLNYRVTTRYDIAVDYGIRAVFQFDDGSVVYGPPFRSSFY